MLKLIRIGAFAGLFMVFAGADQIDKQIVHYEAPAPLPKTITIASRPATNSGILHVD